MAVTGMCGAYFGLGGGQAAICCRPIGHPPISVDVIGHDPRPLPIVQKVLDNRAERCYNDLMTTTDTPTPEQHVALVDALIPFARATLGQDAHPQDIAYHCWVTLEQGYPITGVDMALVTQATTAFIDNNTNKPQEG